MGKGSKMRGKLSNLVARSRSCQDGQQDGIVNQEDNDVVSMTESGNHSPRSNGMGLPTVSGCSLASGTTPSRRTGRIKDYLSVTFDTASVTTTGSNRDQEDFFSSTATATKDPECSVNFLSSRYESLDYETCENTLYVDELSGRTREFFSSLYQQNITRWFVIFVIALLTAMTACIIVMVIDLISEFKFSLLKSWMDHCHQNGCLYIPLLMWFGLNGLPVMLGSILVTYWAPVASGSGIPLIKCYLNGVKVPEVVRFKTFLVKAIGVITSVSGGLACGKEGPMIHCGSVIAAGISQGKTTSFKKDFKIFKHFREDKEKRDFVSAGAAAGVAAAFGAPVGGVLFSLEEGASFWNQSLTWKIFFCSMMSTFTLNIVMSVYRGKPGELSYPGLLNFGAFDDVSYSFLELPVYLLLGAFGGIFGSFFNYVNFKLTVFRMKYLKAKWIRVMEAVLVAMSTAAVGFILISLSGDCRQNSIMPNKTNIQMNCPDGQHSVMSELWFDTPEATVRALFHKEPDSWTATTLFIFFTCYLLIACWTYGLSVSGGIFIPCLLIGAAGGRLIAIGALRIWQGSTWISPGKFALVGAAAMLGGVVRMTISLTVILIEATGNITFGIPIMLALITAKWVGDYFNEGLYDIHIRLNSIPLLSWEPVAMPRVIYASEVMSAPVVTFRTQENVGHLIDTLRSEKHNGFPVVDEEHSMSESLYESIRRNRCSGRFRGMILRWQLIILLKKKMFNENSDSGQSISLEDFRDAYPRYERVEKKVMTPGFLTDEERLMTIDLRPFMNPSPYSVPHTASLPRIFRLFRALGLRHLVVINDRNGVAGIVTRKDLARFRLTHSSSPALHRLEFSQS
jgi:chloride channel 7